MRGRDEGIRGLKPYYAPNPFRGGAAKGARGGRGRRNSKFAPQLWDPAWAGDFGIRPSVVPHVRDYGGL